MTMFYLSECSRVEGGRREGEGEGAVRLPSASTWPRRKGGTRTVFHPFNSSLALSSRTSSRSPLYLIVTRLLSLSLFFLFLALFPRGSVDNFLIAQSRFEERHLT